MVIIVLDSNEYIKHINEQSNLLNPLFQRVGFYFHLHKIIRDEVLRNLRNDAEKDFFKLVMENGIYIDEDILPIALFHKYKELGLNKGDIAIASFCEKIGADYLITENRDFLKSKNLADFQVLSLREFLRLFKLI
ncbi:hypothetical protein J4443_02400 [Candidatus Woesearchaeota archaeon]|nr:hypothetical protein [Candidatus Woesearchaeota archaeon]